MRKWRLKGVKCLQPRTGWCWTQDSQMKAAWLPSHACDLCAVSSLCLCVSRLLLGHQVSPGNDCWPITEGIVWITDTFIQIAHWRMKERVEVTFSSTGRERNRIVLPVVKLFSRFIRLMIPHLMFATLTRVPVKVAENEFWCTREYPSHKFPERFTIPSQMSFEQNLAAIPAGPVTLKPINVFSFSDTKALDFTEFTVARITQWAKKPPKEKNQDQCDLCKF